ncbi:MAG: hypothetical protein K2R98_22815 [Gemmataceae bacterium]|nr:hypothetical protein [Gemmataceae bacterium]
MSQHLIASKPTTTVRPVAVSEELLAQLTDAAFRAALEHGVSGSTIQLQLELWTSLRKVVDRYFDIRRDPPEQRVYPEIIYLGAAARKPAPGLSGTDRRAVFPRAEGS